MHVEIRLYEVEQACAFDMQSFYRVKQLLASRGGSSGGDDNSSVRTISPEPMISLRQKHNYTPQLKLQLVVERLIEMEGRAIGARMNKKQHEARTKSNWNNSDVGTAYHSATINEVILAALPLAAADSVVKIRLLQLPPPLDYDAQQTVKKALNNVTVNEYRHDTPLCIGVAKVTLRDMMSARRTVNIAMQAKRTIFSTVEAHNLDTLVTNAMFGKDEESGSALLSIQINGYTFGRVPRGRLLMYNGAGDGSASNSAKESEAFSTGKQSASTAAVDNDRLEEEAELLNSPAIRFVLIPYVAFVDVLLRISDVVSWRVPRKTAMAFAMVLVALYADLFDAMIVLVVTLNVLLFLRNISLFYCVPISDSSSRTSAALTLQNGAMNYQPYLYSRDNALLNSLLRARVFFSRGLLRDTYFELALSAHLARHSRRQIAAFVLAVCAGFLSFSMGTVVILLIVAVFSVYPMYLNAPAARRQRRKALLGLSTLHSIAKAFRTPERLRVVRVVRVAVVKSKSVAPPPEDCVAASNSEVLQQQFLGYLRQRTESIGAGSATDRSEVSPQGREGSTMGIHRRARTMDLDGIGTNTANFSSTIDHFQLTHALRYFVALCFSPSVSEAVGFASTTGNARRASGCGSLQRRMADQLRQARALNIFVTTEFPQISSISAGSSSAFPAQPSMILTESKPSAVSKEVQDMFHAYFNSTISFLSYLRQQSTVHPYVTQSILTKCVPDSMRSVSVLAPTHCLVDVGDDDGVTKAIVGRRVSASALPAVGKFNISSSVEITGRVMALYAAYLLQGARLSIYTSASGCSTIIPLMAPGDRVERFSQPNPCPLDLLNTLDSVWRGETTDTAMKGEEVFFTADAVIQIITVYKNFWTGETGGSSGRTTSKYDPGNTADASATHSPQRNPIRNVFASLAPMPRHLSALRSATTNGAARSPRGPLSPGVPGNGTTVNVSTFSRSDLSATRAGPATPGLAPLRLPPPTMVERSHTNFVSETTGSIELDGTTEAMSEPPLLEATTNGNSRAHSLVQDEKDSPNPKQSISRNVSTRFDGADKTLKTTKKP
jgi:hypothetical protein